MKHIETLDGTNFLDDLKLEYFTKKITLEKELFQNKIITQIDIVNGDLKGVISPLYKEEKIKIDFLGNIYDKLYIQIPKWGGEYKTLDKKHIVIEVNKPSFLKHHFNFLEFQENSSIYIDKKDGVVPTAYVKNIDFDFKKYQEPQNFDTKPGLNYNLYWENSKIVYDKYQFVFKKGEVVSKGSAKEIVLHAKDSSKIIVKSDNNNLLMRSDNLSGAYVNSIFQKDLLRGGNVEFFMAKNTVDSYMGSVKITNTTLKDLQFVDNLLLFVNSTPALINPLLGIPTLLRFGKDSFSVSGYNVVDGEFQFIYHKATNILEIKNLKTLGNLNNFSGDLEINLSTNEVTGKLNVAFLKDFASIIRFIPLVGQIVLDKKDEISIPITIHGTLEDPQFSLK